MLIAIDPGQNGGIAWTTDGGVTKCADMPDTPKDIFDLLQDITDGCQGAGCYLEQVGTYMPGNSGPAAVKFARHCGHLDMALLALGISHSSILPAKWEHWFIGKPAYPKIPKETHAAERRRLLAERKRERKTRIKAKAQALFPGVKVTLKTADALGMLAYAMEVSK